MNVFQKPISAYVEFTRVFLALILLTGIVRFALSLAGMPNSTVRWFSMTALVWIAVVYFSIRVHTSRFGSYMQLLVICALLNLSEQCVSIFGIVVSGVTGTPNIFSAPEYSFGGVNVWLHAASHVVIGLPAGSLIAWVVGSLILAVTRRVASPREALKSTV